jgi:hypothetical protein
MRKAEFAEWILSLVVPPDQAAAITGDFFERATDRGSIWFWVAVCRTLISVPARNLTEQPLSLGLLVFKGFGLVVLGEALLLIPALAVSLFIPPAAQHLVYPWVPALVLPVFQFAAGRWVARRLKGRELSAWLGLAVLETLLNTAVIVSTVKGWLVIPVSIACFALYQIPSFLGAAGVRRRNLIHFDHSPAEGTH